MRSKLKLPILLTASFASLVIAGSSTPDFTNSYSESPTSWFNEVSESEYFDSNFTSSWQTNETCDSGDALSVVTYNIWHNIAFVSDFGDEMEQSLGKVSKCADIVMFQEAWDYDDMIQDGPKDDMAARGFNMITPNGYYCDDPNIGIENDCSGLLMFYKTSLTLVKQLGFEAFNDVNGFDVHKEKGLWGAIFAKNGQYYYVFDTHFTYGDAGHLEGSSASDNSRISNMAQSKNFMASVVNANKASYPPALVIYGGDFNADFDSTNSNSNGQKLLNASGSDAAFIQPYDIAQAGATMGEFETSGFRSVWSGGQSQADTGPNASTSGYYDYDIFLIGDPAFFGGCSPTNVEYSGWAPAWNTLNSDQRKWPYYTHSDHYGRWMSVTAGC
mgnify:CR=1 FL=1